MLMESVIVAAIVVLTPVLLAQFMRANAGAMFLSACGGIVLLSTLDPVLVTTAGAIIPAEGEAIVRVLVVVATIVIASVLFRDTVVGMRSALNVVTGLLLGFLLLTQLPALTGLGVLIDIVNESWWRQIDDYSSLIVVAGLLVSLSMVLLKKHSHKKHKKH